MALALARSWLDDQATKRRYRFPDGSQWDVQNEYRPVECPDCGGLQYLRATHIWHYARGGRFSLEAHVNLGKDLAKLKALLISYLAPGDVPVLEVEVDGRWALMANEERIAEQVP